MYLPKIHRQPVFFQIPQTTLPRRPEFPLKFNPSSSYSLLSSSLSKPSFKLSSIPNAEASIVNNKKEKAAIDVCNSLSEFDDLAPDGDVYLNTLRLVECSMFAAVTGLVYFLSNSLSIEVATAMLLLVLSGPVKALAYLLTHGVLGFSMGSLWRLGVDWGLSIFLCTIARSAGAMGYILTSSFLIRENILALITINIHASLTFIFSAAGVNIVPSMNVIYVIFGTLVLLNSGFFVFLLHLLYSVFLTRLGMKASLRLPRWLEMAL
ncbi:Membrane protein [Citrus sinensis]|nr:Membrane protein [Citrus sinensis]